MGPPDRLKKNAPAPEIKTQKSSMSFLVHQCSVGTCWFIGCLGTVRCLGWVLWIVVSLWRRWWDIWNMMVHECWRFKAPNSIQIFKKPRQPGASRMTCFHSLPRSCQPSIAWCQVKKVFSASKNIKKTFRVGPKKNWKNKKVSCFLIFLDWLKFFEFSKTDNQSHFGNSPRFDWWLCLGQGSGDFARMMAISKGKCNRLIHSTQRIIKGAADRFCIWIYQTS